MKHKHIKATIAFVLFFICSAPISFGQYYIHVDVHPDIKICMYQLTLDSNQQPDTIVNIDIQNDGIDDFCFQHSYMGYGVYYHYKEFFVEIIPYANTTFPSFNNSSYSLVVDSLGTTVDSSSMSSQNLYLYKYFSDFMPGYQWDSIAGLWFGQYDKYLYLQNSNLGSIMDAWVKISCDSSGCLTIKDFYYRYTLNTNDNIFDKTILYPNPSNGNFILEMNNSEENTIQIEIFDIAGKLILANTIDDAYIKQQLTMEKEANGVYFLKLTSDKHTATYKLVKY